jgi:soluble lytic murein transglycosylase
MRQSGWLAAFVLILFSTIVHAGEVFYYVDENGVYHFSDQRKDQKYDKMLVWQDGDYEAKKVDLSKDYIKIIEDAAKYYGLDSALIKAMVRAESSFKKDAVSSAGAQGLMQLMPETAKKFLLKDPFDPEDNVFAGTALMKALMVKYKEDIDLALAAYNAGETAVDKHKGVPPYPETQQYIKRVLKYREEYNKMEIPDIQKEFEDQ